MEKWKLLRRIKRQRRRLNRFAHAPVLTDPKIVRVSRELDQLINQYYGLSEVG